MDVPLSFPRAVARRNLARTTAAPLNHKVVAVVQGNDAVKPAGVRGGFRGTSATTAFREQEPFLPVALCLGRGEPTVKWLLVDQFQLLVQTSTSVGLVHGTWQDEAHPIGIFGGLVQESAVPVVRCGRTADCRQ